MTESKGQSNLRQINNWQRDAARAEYLRHPDASIAEVARATNAHPRTVARARAALVKEGLLPAGRKGATAADAIALVAAANEASGPSEAVTPAVAAPRGSKGQTIDGEALRAMSELLDQLADEDDETTRKRMLRQVKKFAFDPNLHPDTRMSASQLWAKLLDMARAKDLGPGKPMSVTTAVDRARDFQLAIGVHIAVVALFKAFTTEQVLAAVNSIFAEREATNATSTQAVDESHAAQASAQPVGPPDNDTQTGSPA